MIRLSVDTSFEHLGVCLTRNGVCLANYYSLCNRKNSSIIFGVVDELLKNTEIKLVDIDAYVVNRGPGSYTGVRIAMGVVKTFAHIFCMPNIKIIRNNSIFTNNKLIRNEINYCILSQTNPFKQNMEWKIE